MTKAKAPKQTTNGKIELPIPVIIRPIVKIEFTHDQLFQAMLHAQEQMQRCQILFVVLGDAAHAIYYNHPMTNHRIVFGVLQQHAVPNLVSVLKVVEPDLEMLTDGWRFTYERVPVYVKIITKNYHTLTNPDTKFYYYDVWKIPNPFNEYWECETHYDI